MSPLAKLGVMTESLPHDDVKRRMERHRQPDIQKQIDDVYDEFVAEFGYENKVLDEFAVDLYHSEFLKDAKDRV